VQHVFEFPGLPGNIPGLIAVSAGTALGATGIAGAVGSKGAGSERPGWSDLLTVGGVVVPERLQFVIWTIVGILVFVSSTVLRDPATVKELPGVPPEFLVLMGVASAGYLGGKVLRKPGPVITDASALWENQFHSPPGLTQPTKLTVNIIGQNLATNPGIRFNGDLKVEYFVKDAKPSDNLLEFVARDPKATDDSLASQLRLTIKDQDLIEKIRKVQDPQQPPPFIPPGNAAQQQKEDDANKKDLKQIIARPKISLTNPDGQMAEWSVRIMTKSS
jgi:hypothetical protein